MNKELTMKNSGFQATWILFLMLAFLSRQGLAQSSSVYQKGLSAERNLQEIGSLSAYSVGGTGFDTRYEGVVGSPLLFDTLQHSLLKVEGQDLYISIDCDLDVFNNRLLYIHPRTRQIMSIPSDIVEEVIIITGEKDHLFRTSERIPFERNRSDIRFCEILNDGKYKLLKVAEKRLIEADYKKIYSSGKRYDEFETKFRYYINSEDGLFHQTPLTVKALSKLFPEKKSVIEEAGKSGEFKNEEEMAVKLLNMF